MPCLRNIRQAHHCDNLVILLPVVRPFFTLEKLGEEWKRQIGNENIGNRAWMKEMSSVDLGWSDSGPAVVCYAGVSLSSLVLSPSFSDVLSRGRGQEAIRGELVQSRSAGRCLALRSDESLNNDRRWWRQGSRKEVTGISRGEQRRFCEL